MRRLDVVVATGAVVGLVLLPTAVHGWPTTTAGWVALALVGAGGLSLAWWRTRPRLAGVLALGSFLAAVMVDGSLWFPNAALVLFSGAWVVLALGWSGRDAWVAAACGAFYLIPFYVVSGMDNWVPAVMFTVPPFVAGTVLRLRDESAHDLAVRSRELEEERTLFAELALRQERARIASELHDIIGHAISVMVIQAAAGQRLVDTDPERAKDVFAVIAESARQGREDLQRLIELLNQGGVGEPDLSLVDEVVARAGRSGLNVTCRFVGSRDGVPEPVSHLAFRVVQESLTNALRYAPGADVRIVLRADDHGRSLDVRVENDGVGAAQGAAIAGTGRGLVGLRERVQALGGHLVAGPTIAGGWAVDAHLPG